MLSSAKFQKLNGNTLKLIACITMIIDHFAQGVIMISINKAGVIPFGMTFETIEPIYYALRNIGRIAFPIYCYLLVEGYTHTKNRLRYALSLLLFGIISEPIYDITFFAEEDVFNPSIIESLLANRDYFNEHSNAFFTLFIGLLCIWAFDSILKKGQEKGIPYHFSYLLASLPSFVGIFIAEKIICDYHGYGIASIMVLYLLKDLPPYNLIVSYMILCAMNTTEYYALPAYLLLFCYNKKRGRNLGKLKYAFYVIYPVHILVMFYIRCFLVG